MGPRLAGARRVPHHRHLSVPAKSPFNERAYTSGEIPAAPCSSSPLSSGTIGPGRGVNLHTQIPTIDLERRERRRLRIAGRTRVRLQQWATPRLALARHP